MLIGVHNSFVSTKYTVKVKELFLNVLLHVVGITYRMLAKTFRLYKTWFSFFLNRKSKVRIVGFP